MSREEIEKLVTSYLQQALGGLEIENPKFDFKEQWYDLTKNYGISEFLKDTSAIANTFGPDGFIVIGFNAKTMTFKDSLLKYSNLIDSSQITDLINKKVDRLFNFSVYDVEIDKNKLSVIHIPPSLDKPHVIRNHQTFDASKILKKEEAQRIFVRKGTSTYPASKYDIELMFYDRKNIVPDYFIESSFHSKTLKLNIFYNNQYQEWNTNNSKPLESIISLTIENLGRRPVSIIKFQIDLFFIEDTKDEDKLKLESEAKYLSDPITIQPGQIVNEKVGFVSKKFTHLGWTEANAETLRYQQNVGLLYTNSILLTLATGTQIVGKLTIS